MSRFRFLEREFLVFSTENKPLPKPTVVIEKPLEEPKTGR
jgi:hypothetical protein